MILTEFYVFLVYFLFIRFFAKIRVINRFSCFGNPRSRRMHSINFDDIFVLLQDFMKISKTVDHQLMISWSYWDQYFVWKAYNNINLLVSNYTTQISLFLKLSRKSANFRFYPKPVRILIVDQFGSNMLKAIILTMIQSQCLLDWRRTARCERLRFLWKILQTNCDRPCPRFSHFKFTTE